MRDLREYNSSQWWCKELEGIWNAELGSTITHDMKRAAKVAINMVKEVEALHLKNTEAWREDYRKKQAAGVRFENYNGSFWWGMWCTFNGNKEDYREVPQESPKVKEIGVGIPEASREVLKQWQANGLKFLENGKPINFPLKFDYTTKGNYTIPEQPIPEGMSAETVEAMWRQGLRVEFKTKYQEWVLVEWVFNWEGEPYGKGGAELIASLRIPAQPIPEKLLEVPQDVLLGILRNT